MEKSNSIIYYLPNHVVMDTFDKRILKLLAANSKMTLKEMGRKVGLFSASSISKRISSLEEEGYVRNYRADIDYEKLGYNFMTITFIQAKYRYGYSRDIGKQLSDIPGVIGVYFILGEIDFVVFTISKNKEEYSQILDKISQIEGVERSDTRTILETHKNFSLSDLEM